MKHNWLAADIHTRFDTTILRYKGMPYYVRCPPGETNLTLYKLDRLDMAYKTIDAWDDDLDVSSVPLGFFNCDAIGAAIYAMRMPYRKFKQGVCSNNTSLRYVTANGRMEETGDVQAYLISAGFGKSLEGNFPSLKAALSEFANPLMAHFKSVALSRHVALARTGAVFYREEMVGKYDFKTNVLDVPGSQFADITSLYLSGFDWRVR
jgi:hypothetical protein